MKKDKVNYGDMVDAILSFVAMTGYYGYLLCVIIAAVMSVVWMLNVLRLSFIFEVLCVTATVSIALFVCGMGGLALMWKIEKMMNRAKKEKGTRE